ncbi:MAG TPA: hypothetical protein VJ489_02260 [Thermoplasmata archaeon]|nr:hypothetical protein [Thermoplasmata archaeon]
MKILLSTFGQDDFERVVQAMRMLPYERLVLIGTAEAIESRMLAKIRALEEMSGHEVADEAVPENGFMEIVDMISEILERHARDSQGRRNDLVLNISGGSKLLGDAALFAAFRLGIEAYHCEDRLTKLPVLKGLTAKDRFTPSQIRFIREIDGSPAPLDRIAESVSSGNKAPVERVMRELKKAGLIVTEVRSGKIVVGLSESGAEVARAVRRS